MLWRNGPRLWTRSGAGQEDLAVGQSRRQGELNKKRNFYAKGIIIHFTEESWQKKLAKDDWVWEEYY